MVRRIDNVDAAKCRQKIRRDTRARAGYTAAGPATGITGRTAGLRRAAGASNAACAHNWKAPGRTGIGQASGLAPGRRRVQGVPWNAQRLRVGSSRTA